MGLRRHPHCAGLLLVDVTHVTIEELSEHFNYGFRVALHNVVLGVRYSEELRLSSLEVSVGLDDPIGSL